MFFTFIKKTLKTCINTLNYSIHSNKKHRQYESNKVNNTVTKHSLCPGNGVFVCEKCIIFEILYVFVSKKQNTSLKNKKTIKNKKKHKKHVFKL